MSETATYYAQVIDDVVVTVHVVSYDYLVANPDRYGDPDNWLQVFTDGTGRGYPGIGWIYDSATDTFNPPPDTQIA